MNRSAVLSVFLLALPVSTSAYKVPELEYWKSYELQLINISREEHGLPPVGLDEGISEVSQSHAADSAVHFDDSTELTRRATYLGHDSSDGKSFPTRITEFGIDGLRAAGESVGFRYRGPIGDIHEMIKESLELMHSGMMAEVPPDDGHRKTILGDYTHVGIGLEFQKDRTTEINALFLVTDFGKFNEGRMVIIPELMNAPKPLLRSELQKIVPSISPMIGNRSKRARLSMVPASSPSLMPSASWGEKHRMRLDSRRNKSTAQLMGHAEQRKQIRLQHLQGF